MIKLYYFKDDDPAKYVNKPYHKYVYLFSDNHIEDCQTLVTNKQTNEDRSDYFLETFSGEIESP